MNIWGYLTIGVIGSIAKRVLSALGVGVVAYKGFGELLGFVQDQVHSLLSGLPLAAMQLAGLADIDIGINIIFSAYTVSIFFIVAKRFTKS